MPNLNSLAKDYVELRCCSAFSFLEGASNPEDLVDQAVTLGHSALALADRNGLYGAPRFFQAAKRAGLRSIVGAELEIRDPSSNSKQKAPSTHSQKLQLLVESQRGYRNLSRLLTLAQQRSPKGEAFAHWNELEAHAVGLIALARGDNSLTHSFLDRNKALFPGRLWVDISRHHERRGEIENRYAVALANSTQIPIVATGDVRYAYSQGRYILDVFRCLRAKTVLDQAGKKLTANHEHALIRREDTVQLFYDHPNWLHASREIAERCNFTLNDLGYRFPNFCCPTNENSDSWLRTLTFEGAKDRYGRPLMGRIRDQLEHELAVIKRLDLSGYFLIVYDIARYARDQGILCQGRGSAANSAVCYALGITAVDPIGMDLLFERFLSEERSEWPDIDIDLPSGEQRERVIQYVFSKYGERAAAMTPTVITYKTRSAVREMGKVLGLAPDTIGTLANLLSSVTHQDNLEELHAELYQAGLDPKTPRLATLFHLVNQVRGLPRYLGQHTGGIVIAEGQLDEIVPIEPATMANRAVIQWDKDDCANLGLIKIDLLGLGMLNALEEIVPLVRNAEGIEIDLAHLPSDDKKTYEMIQRADTIGVFQIESRAQMATLPRMKPRCFYDLVVEIAIIRPGPIVGKLVNPYLNRRSGREPIRYPHPDIEPILERTLGVPIFQEQLLRIAMVMAEISGGEAEELRRAMGFKRSGVCMKNIEKKLRNGMAKRGVTGETQEEIIQGITSFALYGFPESHSASFALIAYASAYLRAHHPAAFLAGMLNAYPLGFYNPATLVKDAQRHGVEVRPIDVMYSEWRCTLENTGKSPATRLGLCYVKGLRTSIGRALAMERARAPFANVAELSGRIALRRPELDSLAELGALESINDVSQSRRSALWQVAALERDPTSLFAKVQPSNSNSPFDEMTSLETTVANYLTSGMTVGPHLMSYLRPHLQERDVLTADELGRVPHGRYVRTAGHVIVRQRPSTAKGVCFLTLEDETGISNGILTPKQFDKFRYLLQTASILEIAGPIQNIDNVIHVRVLELNPIDIEEVLPPSHDYH